MTAVVVTRGVTHYLPTTLGAVAAQTRHPLRVVLVDVAPTSGADLDRLLASTFTADPGGQGPALRIVHAPGARTFGEAVRAALADAPAGEVPTGWLWLLHDDSAPAPTALAELVRAVGQAPSVGVAGVKQRTWTSPERLLEVGLRTSRSGRRMTDVEPGELDQGQHDGREDVLGVGLAGALVRRDVWDALGGTDPALGPFGDGLDLSRRARLAGHRVVVVPAAVVRHAQAGYLGLRARADQGVPVAAGPTGGPGPDLLVLEADLDGDGEADAADPRRSFAARRRALLHQRLVTAPLALVPVVAVLALAAAVVRALLQVAAKDGLLALAELQAPLAVLARPSALLRARARARRTRALPRRALRPLQASWRDVWTQWRDRRLARLEARRVVRAPSELELRELAALTTRRRTTLATLLVVLGVAGVVGLGRLIGPVLGGAELVGPALLPAGSTLDEVWQAATSGWVAGGLGAAGPADALLTALLPAVLVAGGSLSRVVAVLVLGAVLIAGAGAWAACGAATRSTAIRFWAALVWAGAPVLLLGVGDGRLGLLLAHAALPWLALGVARALGVQRVDQVLSGLETVRREPEPDEAEVATPVRGTPVVVVAHDAPTTDPAASPDATSTQTPAPVSAPVLVGAPDPTGSVGAAAAAGLAAALVVAGAPSLLLPVLVALVVVALCARRGRARLLLVALPPLVLLGPLLAEVARRGPQGLRLLLADPGPAAATAMTSAAPGGTTSVESALDGAVGRLLGLPGDPVTLVPDGLPTPLATWWPMALGAVVVLLALLALLRGAPVARAVRAAWVVVALGLATATVAVAVPVALDAGAVVRGSAGPGVSLAWLGLVTAAVLGADRLQARIARASFGWRQPVVALLAAVAMVVPVVQLGGWAWASRGGQGGLGTVDRPLVQAVAQQSQGAPDTARVLAVQVQDDGTVEWQLLRGDGPLLVDSAAAVQARQLTGDLRSPSVSGVDQATAEVDSLVARLATGAGGGDVSGELGELAVADVLVPPVDETDPTGAAAASGVTEQARAELVGRLDATAGLQRVTDNEAGTLWRVAASADAQQAVVSWAQMLPGGASGAGAGEAVVAVAADGRTVDTRVPAGEEGRVLVLAERADAHWRAWLDGSPVRTVEGDWRQTFALGADGGRLEVRYVAPERTPWLVLQAVVLGLTVLLALPVRRRGGRR
ncbi:glycosyltransferase [Cellulomonas soli]|uniref:glycosyltransferase family 2 protein n=1 Tax=Cellulomonas soli TaxID=931535 RepID=UPI003F844B77